MSDLSLSEAIGLKTADPRYERYRVTGKLGVGGMGQVLLGRDLQLQREVAIKVVLGEASADAAERFRREAEALARINHSSILRVFDYSGPDAEKLFLVTERLLGTTLEAHILEGPLSEAMTCVVGAELAAGLSAAHATGLVHRDVKPENIFLEPAGRVVLIDFGVAKGFAGGLGSDRRLTGGALVGTPRFASPEQCNAEPEITPASDLFSLGAVLYYCVTRKAPFDGGSLFTLLDQVANHPHLPLIERAAVSREFSTLVDRLLAKQPADRIASAEVLSRKLSELAAREKLFSSSQTIRDYLAPSASAARSAAPAKEEEAAPESTSDGIEEEEEPERQWRPAVLIALALLGAAIAISAALFVAAGKRSPSHSPSVALPVVAPPPIAEPPPTPPPAATAKPTRVHLVVKPWANVSVDGVVAGTTPTLRDLDLAPGTHEVVFEHPSFGSLSKTVDVGLAPPSELIIDMHAAHHK